MMTSCKHDVNTATRHHDFYLNELGVGVAVVDSRQTQVYVNAAFCELVGYSHEELIGQRAPFRYWPPEDVSRLGEMLRTLNDRGKAASDEVHFLSKEGRRVPVDLNIRRVDRAVGDPVWVAAVRDISERHIMMARLERSESLYRAAFNFGSIGVVIADATGVITRANDAFGKMLGMNTSDIVGHSWTDFTSPEYRDQDRSAIDDMLIGRMARYSTEKMYTSPHRGQFWARVEVSPIHDPGTDTISFVAKVIDIDQERLATISLAALEHKFQRIVDVIPEVFWMASADLTQTKFVSKAFDRIWGFSVEELYANPARFIDAIHEEDRDAFRYVIDKFQKREKTRFSHEYRIVRPNGEIRWIWDQGFPVAQPDGSIIDFIGIAQDVTRRKELERDLMKAQALESVGMMAGQLAHDFNNLLGAITMNATYLKRRSEHSRPSQDAIDAILSAADRGSGVIRALLAAARRQRLVPTTLDLVSTLYDSQVLLKSIGEKHVLRLETSVPRLLIKVDKSALEQSLLNLVLNSADAMPGGGRIVIRLRQRDVSIQEAAALDLPAGPYAVIEVEDCGCGMAEEVIRRATEPFFSTKEGIGGTGLGLPAISGFARQSGGRFEINSKIGDGTRVSLLLPVHSPGSVHPETALARKKQKRVRRVLLVDDDVGLRNIVSTQLIESGYVVFEADDGEKALRTLAEQRVDVVVSDVMLRGMNGRELRGRIERRYFKPVILMTGYTFDGSDPVDQEDIIAKPFAIEELIAAIEKQTLYS